VSGLFHALPRLLAPLLLVASACVGHATDPITTRTDEIGKLLNEWAAKGTAAGLKQLTYENRDDAHSALPAHLWPDLKVHAFTEADRTSGRFKGLATVIRDRPTLGNCSMAAPADRGGSLPRIYFMDPAGSTFLAKQYLSNQLFIYPEHQDHDPGGNGVGGWGDLFPLNTASLLITQGSSGSDQPFLQALLSTAAAFTPDVQRTLIERRLLAPTLQHLLRRHSRRVQTDEDYLSGKAHPIVFDATHLDEKQMVLAANRMTPGGIPPVALIAIQEETAFEPGAHFFEPEKPHPWQLATTPVSIARLFRGHLSRYEGTITTQASGDLLARPLSIKAVLLQGNPAAVQIKPDSSGRNFRLSIRWQPPEEITPESSALRSHRIDIGFFADNGVAVSAPAIFSLYLLPNERRFYDSKDRLTQICYLAANPDLGLPVDDTDPRWIEVIQTATQPADTLPGTLIERALEAPERAWFRVTHSRLRVLQDQLGKLKNDPAPEAKNASAIHQQQLADAIKASLSTILPGTRKLTARQTLDTAFHSIARFADLYPSFQQEIDTLATQSPQAESVDALKAEVQKLINWGVLIRQTDGKLTPAHDQASRSPAESYYLRALNLTVLSHTLYPHALERQAGPAWVDPRLTTRKAWRDSLHYDDTTGTLLGWTRYLAGKTLRFDAQGRCYPEPLGSQSPPVPGVYFPDPSTGLRFEPVK